MACRADSASATTCWPKKSKPAASPPVAHGAADVAGVDAFDDAGQLPVAERDVEVDGRQVAARTPRRSARAARRGAGSPSSAVAPPTGGRRGVAGVAPVDQQQPDVGERVAERADLPVEHGDDARRRRRPCSCRAGSRRGRSWPAPASGIARWQRRRGPRRRSGQLAGLRLLELAVPALELARDVALVAAEVAEADGVDVDGVDARPARRRSTRWPCGAARA